MKHLLTLLTCIFIINAGLAQQCTNDNVTTLPGKWLTGMKGDHDHTAADVIKERAILDNIARIIRSNFTWQPVGGDITTGNAYSIRGLDYRPKPIRKIGNTYSTFIFFQHYFCVNGKIDKDDFYDQVTVSINTIPFKFERSFFVSKKDAMGYDIEKDPETDVYDFSETIPEIINGEYNFSRDKTNNNANGERHFITSYRMLLKQGQLPFVAMTKKEYYEKNKILHQKAIEAGEAEKAKLVLLAKSSGNNRDVEYKESGIKVYRDWVTKIDEQLNSKTPEELSRPAFFGEEYGAYIEKNTADNHKSYVIKPNLACYNATLPKYAPQVITIELLYQYSKASRRADNIYADENFYKELERIHIVDLLSEKLKPMLVY